ncbi:MAG: hypothetical protein M1822_002910 [Bathelium mastoideum]|nr:MAG: hypothetical protein M1822_002910 [Bathelium mastoideum]
MLYFLTKLAANHVELRNPLKHDHALLNPFDASDSNSIGDLSNSGCTALVIRNEYLKAKLLLAKQNIQTLKLEYQLRAEPRLVKGKPELVDTPQQSVTCGRQETVPAETSRTTTVVDTKDLLGIDDESGDWSDRTLTPTKGITHEQSDEASLPSDSPASDESPSPPNQLRSAAGRNDETSSVPQYTQERSVDAVPISSPVQQYMHTSFFKSEKSDASPRVPAKSAQSERRVSIEVENATKELLKRCHDRSFPGTDRTGGVWSTEPKEAGLQSSDQVTDTSGLRPASHIASNQQGCHLSQWAPTPNSVDNGLNVEHKSEPTAQFSALTPLTQLAAPQTTDQYRPPYPYKYPCYYMPPPRASADELLCTVVILGIPPDFDLEKVMSKVRGGIVVFCALLNTTSIIGSNTAMVKFFQGESARKYVEFANSHTNGIFDLGTESQPKVTVSLIPSPTVFSRTTHFGISREGWTRHLVLKGIPETMTLDMIREKIQPAECKQTRDGVLSMWRVPDAGGARLALTDTQDGTDYVHIVFSSVIAGEQAFAIMMADDRTVLGRCRAWCGRDPCDAPLEQLISRKVGSTQGDKPDDQQDHCRNAVNVEAKFLETGCVSTQSNEVPIFLGYDDKDYAPKPEPKIEVMDKIKKTRVPQHPPDREIEDGEIVEIRDQTDANIELRKIGSATEYDGDTELDANLNALCENIESSHLDTTKEQPASHPKDDLLRIDDNEDDIPTESTSADSPDIESTAVDLLFPRQPTQSQYPAPISLHDWLGSGETSNRNGESVDAHPADLAQTQRPAPNSLDGWPTSGEISNQNGDSVDVRSADPAQDKAAPVKDYPLIPGHPVRTQYPLSISIDDWLASEEMRGLCAKSEPLDMRKFVSQLATGPSKGLA